MRLITPLRELNRVPGAPEIGPLRRGLLRRQAGIPQGRHQGGEAGGGAPGGLRDGQLGQNLAAPPPPPPPPPPPADFQGYELSAAAGSRPEKFLNRARSGLRLRHRLRFRSLRRGGGAAAEGSCPQLHRADA